MRRPGPADLHTLPDEMWVEAERRETPTQSTAAASSHESKQANFFANVI